MCATKKRLYYISTAQIISMLLIILSHSVPDNINNPAWMGACVAYFQHAGLTVFMITSAYLAVKTKPLERYGYPQYVIKRAVRLLLPYVCFSLLMLIPKYVLSAYSSAKVTLNPLAILKQFLIPREGILPHLWFLPVLFVLSLALPVWIKLAEKKATTCIGLLLLLVTRFLPKTTDILCLNDIIFYAFWFFLGVVCAEYFEKKPSLKWNVILLLFSGLCTLVCILLDYSGFAFRFVSTVFIAAIALLTEDKLEHLCNAVGKYTFPLYIMSLPVQNIVNIVLLKVKLGSTPIFIAEFLLGIIIPFAVAKLIEWIDKKTKYHVLSRIVGM